MKVVAHPLPFPGNLKIIQIVTFSRRVEGREGSGTGVFAKSAQALLELEVLILSELVCSVLSLRFFRTSSIRIQKEGKAITFKISSR